MSQFLDSPGSVEALFGKGGRIKYLQISYFSVTLLPKSLGLGLDKKVSVFSRP